ncbi:hypothetical protein RJ641_005919 [Dillenia turbinata]|uniref:Uncharacterized protein n=1 Tax=Dillenia turbinata TaxID=194707 RepID=A0AAN8VGR5_9MAGN
MFASSVSLCLSRSLSTTSLSLLSPSKCSVFGCSRFFHLPLTEDRISSRKLGAICIEEGLPDDTEILGIAEMLRLNVPMAMKLTFDGLKGSEYKTRDPTITDVGGFEKIELSVLLCNDDFICNLNKDWRDEEHPTDVLSMSLHISELKLLILMLDDIAISVETAARQAEERGHTLIDEIRILVPAGNDGLAKMALKTLHGTRLDNQEGDLVKDRRKEGSLHFYRPKFSFIFCDMDGTLLNSKSQITTTTAHALREALSRGVKVVIATGKARPSVMDIFRPLDLTGKDGVVSEASPGVFLQGLLVYGRQGHEIFTRNLDPDVCREILLYSLESKVPVVAFCEDRCLSLFDHPLVDSVHTEYHEPKLEIIPSVEQLLTTAEIQKMIFLDTADGISATIWPYWSEVTDGRATVVQAVPSQLLKGIMAIADGENDIKMLELGVALGNGSEKTKAVANVVGASNDEDGVADAIYGYAF